MSCKKDFFAPIYKTSIKFLLPTYLSFLSIIISSLNLFAQSDVNTSHIVSIVETYFNSIDDSDLSTALNCFIVKKQKKVKPILEKIISETDYYSDLSIKNIDLSKNKADVKLTLLQKRWEKQYEEFWEIKLVLIIENNRWKIESVK